MNASILSEIAAGNLNGDQCLGLAIIAAIFAYAVWLHVQDNRDESRGDK